MANFCFKLGDGYDIIIFNQSCDMFSSNCIVKMNAVLLISVDSKLFCYAVLTWFIQAIQGKTAHVLTRENRYLSVST